VNCEEATQGKRNVHFGGLTVLLWCFSAALYWDVSWELSWEREPLSSSHWEISF
jgi:hypothetical protein